VDIVPTGSAETCSGKEVLELERDSVAAGLKLKEKHKKTGTPKARIANILFFFFRRKVVAVQLLSVSTILAKSFM